MTKRAIGVHKNDAGQNLMHFRRRRNPERGARKRLLSHVDKKKLKGKIPGVPPGIAKTQTTTKDRPQVILRKLIVLEGLC